MGLIKPHIWDHMIMSEKNLKISWSCIVAVNSFSFPQNPFSQQAENQFFGSSEPGSYVRLNILLHLVVTQ